MTNYDIEALSQFSFKWAGCFVVSSRYSRWVGALTHSQQTRAALKPKPRVHHGAPESAQIALFTASLRASLSLWTCVQLSALTSWQLSFLEVCAHPEKELKINFPYNISPVTKLRIFPVKLNTFIAEHVKSDP